MSDHQIRIVAKPRKEVDLQKLARVVIELAKQLSERENPPTSPTLEPEIKEVKP